jgi:8-oxo-dGTP diphosphatase
VDLGCEILITLIVKGMIIRDKKILIIKRHRNQKVVPGEWEMVGGKVGMEENLEEGLLREIKEETNLDCSIERLLYATDHNIREDKKVVILVYLCNPLSEKVVISHEHEEYRWVEKKEFREIVYTQIVNDLDRYGALEIEELQ